jgi:hypothetical protein
MAIAEEMKLVIKAEVGNAIANLKEVSQHTSTVQSKFLGMAKSLLATGGAIFSIQALARAMRGAIDAYKVQEIAEAKLAAALRATGRQYDISLRGLADYASELQRVTTFGDEVTISAMAMLQQLGDLDEQGLRKITPLVQDFATAMGVDLQTAASLVGKTLGSSTNALSRYGVQIDAAAPKEKKLAELTAILEEKFGGFSQQVALTGSGALAQLNNIMSDIQEEGGKALLDFLKPAIVDLTNFLTKTLQSWAAQKNLNMALKGQATSVYEIDQALKEQNKRIGEAGISQQNLARQIIEAQVAFDKEAKAVKDGKSAINSTLPALGTRLASLRAQYDTQSKLISQGQENIDTLNEERVELKRMNDIEAANVRISDAKVKAGKIAIDQARALAGNIASLENRFEASTVATIASAEATDDLAERIEAAEAAFQKQQEVIRQQIALMDKYREKASEAVAAIRPFSDAIGMMAKDSEKGWEMFKEAAKDAIAAVLEMLAKEAFVRALAAAATLNFPAAAAWTAAGLAAMVGAGVVRAMAEGGIVTKPTTALIGEAGPEAVIPLNKMGGMGNLTVVINGSVMEEEGIARRIGAVLARQRRGW